MHAATIRKVLGLGMTEIQRGLIDAAISRTFAMSIGYCVENENSSELDSSHITLG